MNQEQRQQLGKIIVATAKYYSKQIERDVVSMMLDDLSNYDFDLVANAYAVYRSKAENRFFPLPSQIIEILSPSLSQEEDATLLAERIIKLVSTKGYSWQLGVYVDDELLYEGIDGYYETFRDALASFIGESNVSIIERRGTWTTFCNECNENISGVFKKQLIDSCVASLKNKNSLENTLLLENSDVKNLASNTIWKPYKED